MGIVFILLLGLVGGILYFYATKIQREVQEDSGCYYIGGDNSFGIADRFFNEHKQDAAILNKLDSYTNNCTNLDKTLSDTQKEELYSMGVKMIAYNKSFCRDLIVITPGMCLIYGKADSKGQWGKRGQVYPMSQSEKFKDVLTIEQNYGIIGSYTTTTPAKKTSVVGSAAVGAVIAGGAGAAVGAAYAVDKNTHSQPKSETHYIRGNNVVSWKVTCRYRMASKEFTIDTIEISDDLKTEFGPKVEGDIRLRSIKAFVGDASKLSYSAPLRNTDKPKPEADVVMPKSTTKKTPKKETHPETKTAKKKETNSKKGGTTKNTKTKNEDEKEIKMNKLALYKTVILASMQPGQRYYIPDIAATLKEKYQIELDHDVYSAVRELWSEGKIARKESGEMVYFELV